MVEAVTHAPMDAGIGDGQDILCISRHRLVEEFALEKWLPSRYVTIYVAPACGAAEGKLIWCDSHHGTIFVMELFHYKHVVSAIPVTGNPELFKADKHLGQLRGRDGGYKRYIPA